MKSVISKMTEESTFNCAISIEINSSNSNQNFYPSKFGLLGLVELIYIFNSLQMDDWTNGKLIFLYVPEP